MHVVGNKKGSVLIGPTCCEIISKSEKQKLLNRLRKDPLPGDVDPERFGRELTRHEFDSLWNCLCRFLAVGVRYNRIINVTPETVGRTRESMQKAKRVMVYRKPACCECQTAIAA